MVFEMQTRPIDAWPRQFTQDRKRAPFRADYGTTMKDLERELRAVNAKGAVLLMAYEEHEIRLDGRPRAGARPSHPGVILAFTDKTGPKRFPCDRFDHWCANLRAIALALEALRKVDRYGVTMHGEQYAGWAALPPPGSANASVDELRQFVDRILGLPQPIAWSNRASAEAAIQLAERKTHPDAGGNADDFKRVQEARRVLLP